MLTRLAYSKREDDEDTIVEAILSLSMIMPFLKGIPAQMRSTILSLT
jgi:hypothetical protein